MKISKTQNYPYFQGNVMIINKLSQKPQRNVESVYNMLCSRLNLSKNGFMHRLEIKQNYNKNTIEFNLIMDTSDENIASASIPANSSRKKYLTIFKTLKKDYEKRLELKKLQENKAYKKQRLKEDIKGYIELPYYLSKLIVKGIYKSILSKLKGQ